MTLVYACIAPHGSETIKRITSKHAQRAFRITEQGLRTLASHVIRSHPDTIVIATPHSLRLRGQICVVTSENSSGKLEGENGKSVSLSVKCDIEFSRQLLMKASKSGLQVVGANYGSAEGEASDMPMDWGTLVPLWFILAKRGRRPKVSLVTPSREIPLTQNVSFGRIIADIMEHDRSKRFVFIASADQAHAHKKSGPYGFNKAAAQYDEIVLKAIEENNLDLILQLRSKFVENAKPDSLWQLAILAGIANRVKMRSQLFSYQAPTYYGMICAGYARL
jgi:aromatic ring-opening dioxygenase LigB subunit